MIRIGIVGLGFMGMNPSLIGSYFKKRRKFWSFPC
jgi:hypothetical protein